MLRGGLALTASSLLHLAFRAWEGDVGGVVCWQHQRCIVQSLLLSSEGGGEVGGVVCVGGTGVALSIVVIVDVVRCHCCHCRCHRPRRPLSRALHSCCHCCVGHPMSKEARGSGWACNHCCVSHPTSREARGSSWACHCHCH